MDNRLDRELNLAMTNSSWKHTWKHAVFDRHGDLSFQIETISSKETTDELVEDFACYLMGCGFFQGNIIEAFEDYVIEHKEALITGAGRFKNVNEPSFSD